MKLRADFHSHTTYSDGKGSMEDNVRAAIDKGLHTLAITDHGFGHGFFGIKRRNLSRMRAEIEKLKKKYPDIRILFGVEANITGSSGKLDLRRDEMELFDIVLAGYHFGSISLRPEDWTTHLLNFLYKFFGVFKQTARRKNTRGILLAMQRYPFSILTHPGDKGPVDLRLIAKAAKKRGIALEINERHRHLSTEDLKELADLGLNYIVSSDAHRPADIARVPQALERIREAGVPVSQIVNIEEEE